MASSERGIYSAPAVVGLTAVAPELRFSAYALIRYRFETRRCETAPADASEAGAGPGAEVLLSLRLLLPMRAIEKLLRA